MKKVTSFMVATLVAVLFCGISYAGKNVTPPTKPAKKTTVSKDVSKPVSPSKEQPAEWPPFPIKPIDGIFDKWSQDKRLAPGEAAKMKKNIDNLKAAREEAINGS